MNKTALALGIGASLVLAAGPASAAGTCMTEVQTLQQQIGMAEGSNSKSGPNDTGVQQPSPEANVTTGTGANATTTTDNSYGSSVTADNTGSNSKGGPNDPGVQQPSPGTDMSANSSASGSSGTMSPIIAETSRSGELTTPPDSRTMAITSLKKAQLYADAGEEDACMAEVDAAKQALGIK